MTPEQLTMSAIVPTDLEPDDQQMRNSLHVRLSDALAAIRVEREANAQIADYFAANHDLFDCGFDVGDKIARSIRNRR